MRYEICLWTVRSIGYLRSAIEAQGFTLQDGFFLYAKDHWQIVLWEASVEPHDIPETARALLGEICYRVAIECAPNYGSWEPEQKAEAMAKLILCSVSAVCQNHQSQEFTLHVCDETDVVVAAIEAVPSPPQVKKKWLGLF